MLIQEIETLARGFTANSQLNYVTAEDALRTDLIGMKLWDGILIGTAEANDPLFDKMRKEGALNMGTMLPHDWLPDAASVISFFLPFTEDVKKANAKDRDIPADEWLHARIEGQAALAASGEQIAAYLREKGYNAIFPTTDPRFKMLSPYESNWSERHTAYVCGLGTFGLSKGLITEKGMAGRFGSIITNAPIPAAERPYSNPFEYCTMCGACQARCPADAIDKSKGVIQGKDHTLCSPYLKKMTFPPHGAHQKIRYGCGKCQVKVPCESKIPKKPQ